MDAHFPDKTQNRLFWVLSVILLGAVLTFLSGCAGKQTTSHRPEPPSRQLAPLGYTIQVGAFSHINNARRVTDKLEDQGLEPYYFHHPCGLYKVRFGNFSTRRAAKAKAQRLQAQKHIADFYIVSPRTYSPGQTQARRAQDIREQLISTAQGFLGLPYQWGGTRAAEGFDCSGLIMAVYRLNGLNLPRTSREQFRAGTPINRSKLSTGDLVFFAPSGPRVSHVGLYAGNDRFIHAPGSGKTVRFSSLNNRYYQNNFVGARTYLQ
ncbi:MAG: NlpC/P60 family protein [Desulfovermiculus sp.]